MKQKRFCRLGVHAVCYKNKTYSQCVVETDGERVVGWFHFDGELPMTEWRGGTVYIDDICGEMRIVRTEP